ncbi:hypothetical protein BDV40DRAFT_91708 [Aspergillus tamarii]|uniref:Uncharacterized protein n=1 Tax=Aspergillus tamarii TaxID=41984 RepID=A0A5N6UC21_ASPTM|nr:hypothetical protein BDV40DRAFT_91708 [Aspergillus tamarii]
MLLFLCVWTHISGLPQHQPWMMKFFFLFLLPSSFISEISFSPTSVYVLVHSLQLPNALMKTGKSILRYVVGCVTWLLLLQQQGGLVWSD